MSTTSPEATRPRDWTARFWDRKADGYSRQPVRDEASYQRKLETTRGYLTPDMKLLELGCGTGSTALAHAPHAKEILATDVSDRMLEIAREKADRAEIDNVRFERASVDSFEAPDASFDMVLALSLLHLLPDRAAAIDKVHRLLVPGGLFVTSTVCLGDSMAWFRFIGPILHRLGLIPRVDVLTAAELERSVRDAGFEIDHRWEPDGGRVLFLVARKPA